MVHRTYIGLGPPAAAAREFEALSPYVRALVALSGECAPLSVDDQAMGVALDGVQTAAYHFTRRSDFYHALTEGPRLPGVGNGRLRDRAEATAAFQALRPHVQQIRGLQFRCRPFGRDYLALDIALTSLETAAYHFTRIAPFYGASGDSAGAREAAP